MARKFSVTVFENPEIVEFGKVNHSLKTKSSRIFERKANGTKIPVQNF